MKSMVRRIARRDERAPEATDLEPALEPAVALVSTVPTPTIVYNNSSNVNIMYGTGSIINNNHITNYFGNLDLPQGLDAQINAVLKACHVPQAVYNAQLVSGCMDGTRVQILRDIEIWAKDPKGPQIFWLTGMAGTGKSAIAWTVCSRASTDAELILGGSFFCSRSAGSIALRDVRCIVATLAQLLARQSTTFSEALANELARDPDVLHKQVATQVEHLLYRPLLAIKDSSVPIVFVIDALDECGGLTSTNGTPDDAETHLIVSRMLEALVSFSRSTVKLPVKFLVTSRPETHIRDTAVSDNTFSTILRLHTINKEHVNADIRLYISHRLSSSPKLRAQFAENDTDILVRLSDGLFIVAATALEYTLGAGIDVAAVRFETLLNASRDGLSTNAASPLDSMYALILADAAKAGEHEAVKFPDLLRLLAALLSARMTLSVAALADLLDLPITHVRASLSRLHAVIRVPDDDSEAALHALHASFADYMFDRAADHGRISAPLGHEVLAHGCLRIMAKRLHFNVSQSVSSHDPNQLVKLDHIKLSLEYACLEWIYHVSGVFVPSAFDEEVNVVFRPRFLFWLEVVSILGRVGRAAAMLFLAASTVRIIELSHFLRDAHAFVASSAEVIGRSAPHIYLSALPFAPKDSRIYQTFASLCVGLVSVDARGIDRHGGRLVMTLAGHEGTVTSVAYSSDGRLLASGSADATVRIWDTRIGEEMMAPLRSDGGPVWSVVFDPHGGGLVAGTDSGTVLFWSLSHALKVPQRLSGHSDSVLAVAFSSDGSLLASASKDKTLRIWSPETGQSISVLSGHAGAVSAVTFSPDGRLLASGSADRTIRLWDSTTGRSVVEPLGGNSRAIIGLSFSPDGMKFASGSGHGDIRLWDTQTKKSITTLYRHSSKARSVQFSSDGQLLVSASDDQSVRLWTLREDAAEASSIVLDGHTDAVRSVTFSPDNLYIASASADRIWIWDTGSDQPAIQPLAAHQHHVQSVAVSWDGTLIVSGSADRSVHVWDARTGKPKLHPLLGHTDVVSSVDMSSDGRLIASASRDHTVQIWDALTGKAVGVPLEGHKSVVTAVAWSPDALLLASGSEDRTVHLWDVAAGQASNIASMHCSSRVLTVTFSPDGQILAAGDWSGCIHFWRTATSEPIRQPLRVHDDRISSIALSPDGLHVTSNTTGNKICVLDISTGQQIAVFTGHTDPVLSVAYSPDGRFIGSGSADGTVRLWDAVEGTQIAILHGHAHWVESVVFTRDGRSIVSGSATGTIRVWDVEAARSLAAADASDATVALASAKFDKGWLLGPAGELLLWVPAAYRAYYQVSPCTLLIAHRAISIATGERGLHAGSNWISCWRQD